MTITPKNSSRVDKGALGEAKDASESGAKGESEN